jgi:Cys-tRNA(Pro)/Cys-tRNA(Cys) deacylase
MKQLPAHRYLDSRQIPYERRSFPTATGKGAAAVARALGFRERQMVKTLIFSSRQGEHVLVMVGGDQSAISGHLKKAIGSRDIRLADPATVKTLTGYEVGSIPPFGWQPPGVRSLFELSLVEEAVLGVGTGQWGEEILISPENLIRASQALPVNLTDRSRPVWPESDAGS